jgi:hypothetical protein
MNDENPISSEDAASRVDGERPENVAARNTGRGRLPRPLEAAGFAVQERMIWPLQDRFALLGPEPNRALLGGGALALAIAGVAVAVALSSGGGGSAPVTTAAEVATPRQPLAATSDPTQRKPKPERPRETLHGAAPVFTPSSAATKGGVKTGKSKAAESGPSNEASAPASSSSSTPAGARISSNPHNSQTANDTSASSAAAPATVPDGPPAGAAALEVAREFAQGFVVYETGGEEAAFRDAFEASATPQLSKALLRRPPKQPASVKVPKAKVLNVVAGPSRGSVYKVSVSLLRVGVTSELRLDMEKLKSGKHAEWRVTNVLG